MSVSLEIAKTIQAQIGKQILWAIGCQKMMALNETENRLGGLQFQASLFGKFRCVVTVELNGRDTYRVKLTNPRTGALIKEVGDDVYADVLGNLIEESVEQYFASKR